MNDDNENIPGRHRFGEDGNEAVALRDLLTSERRINWALIVALLVCAGFWAWVAHNVMGWLP